jgi:hypothetical protein
MGPPFAAISDLEKRLLSDEQRLLESLQGSTGEPYLATILDVDQDDAQFRETLAALLGEPDSMDGA